jgi:hypothetical protein
MPRKKPIEDRSFLGRVGAILSGEASQRIKRDAKILAPQYSQSKSKGKTK